MATVELLRSLGTVTQVRKDEIIFMEDDFGENMFIVLKGEFGVYVNSFVDFPVRVAEIKSGSFFGEMSVIDGWPRSATIIAEKDGTLVSIDKNHFSTMLEKSPDIADSIMKTLYTRAESTAKEVRGKGKYAPPIPSPPDNNSSDISIKSKVMLMTSLARYIRQLNEKLYEQQTSRSNDKVTLLPEGYEPFNIEDKNDNSNTLQKRNVTCPYCLIKSEAFIPSTNNLTQLRADLDGRIIYKDFNILLYTNLVCPNCNFTDSYREFIKYRQAANHPKYKDNQFKNAENFSGFADTHKHTVDEAVISYYLNLKCLGRATNEGREPLRFAKAWIRMFWMYSDYGKPDFAVPAAKKAIELYDLYLSNTGGEILRQDEIRINTILGELSASAGEYGHARKYFEANIRLGRNTPAMQDLVDKCMDRYKELKSHI